MLGSNQRWKNSLARSSKGVLGQLNRILGVSSLSKETWEELEASLIQADLGLDTTTNVIDSLRKEVKKRGLSDPGELRKLLKEALGECLGESDIPDFSEIPAVILIVGVNGSGKTTAVAKLGKYYKDSGKKVMMIGADTFRAAGTDQLEVWAERLDLPMIAGQFGSDPGAVIYDGIQSATAKKVDIVLIDTAGRLHTRYNLMEELKKVVRVAGKAVPGAPHASWLVIDATTGQNALSQAKAFKETVNANGIILTKLDTSARGGMVFAIKRELSLPILFVGLGEGVSDLIPFEPSLFIDGILAE